MATTNISIKKRYIGNGTTEARRLANFNVKALKSIIDNSYVWHIVFEDGKEIDTRMVARGKDSYRKKDFDVKYAEN